MKTSGYTNINMKIFGSLFVRFNKKPLEEKNQLFVKANIPYSYEEYYSTALMSSVIVGLISVVVSLFLYKLFSLEFFLLIYFLIKSVFKTYIMCQWCSHFFN